MTPPLPPAREVHDFFLEYELLGLTRHHARALAATYFFCYYAGMRVEQAQECWIDMVCNEEFIEGYFCLDKNPVRSKMQPRPFWAPLYWITNSKLYFTTLLDSLKDVTDKCYIFFALTRVQTALFKTRLVSQQDLYCSRMDSWKPFRKFCKWHMGSRSNKVKHTPYTAPITSSQKYQRHGVSLAPTGAKLVDEVTVWLNCPLLDQRLTCCENSEQGFPPFLICTPKNNATQRPLAILGRQMKALLDFSVKCGPGKLPMHGGLQNLTKFKTTGGPHED